MHTRSFAGLAAAAMSLSLTAMAHAQGTIVTNLGSRVLTTPTGQGAYDDGMLPLYANANQHVTLLKDVQDHAALYANHNTLYVKPDAQYLHQRPGRIDQNHSLLRAQRLHASLHAAPTRVIRRVPLIVLEAHEPQPVLIILKPQFLKTRQPQPGPETTPAMPSVPRHEQKVNDTNLMALAD